MVFQLANLMRQMLKELRTLHGLAWAQFTPGPMTVKLLKERKLDNMQLLTFGIGFPPVAADADVAIQRFSYKVDNNDNPPQDFPLGTTRTTVECPQDSNVVLSMKHVDDAGNESLASELAFTATDTLPPAKPGEFSVTLESERTVSDETKKK